MFSPLFNKTNAFRRFHRTVRHGRKRGIRPGQPQVPLAELPCCAGGLQSPCTASLPPGSQLAAGRSRRKGGAIQPSRTRKVTSGSCIAAVRRFSNSIPSPVRCWPAWAWGCTQPHGFTIDLREPVCEHCPLGPGTDEAAKAAGFQVFKLTPDGKVLMTLGKAEFPRRA
jgi:hypothetical protein